MPQQPDILMFLSDQHTASVRHHAGDEYVSTPNLDRLAEAGTSFTNAYTSCPLCVPARSSLLTGQLPSRTGILTNNGVIPSDQATFAHSLGAAGYQTVLVGRMHFLGPDQRHGFERRLVGDFTPCYHGRYGKVRADLGPYVGTPAGEFTKLYGGGTSPVLEYDRAVTAAALDVLKEECDRPRFILVGCYGPHHTFVAPDELYRKYLQVLPLPSSNEQEAYELHPTLNERDFSPELVRSLRAAYYGLVEHVDAQVGRIVDAWDEHLQSSGRDGVFCYLSDHGEQAGERGQWGKMTFYEDSAAIPLLFRGAGVEAGRAIDAPTSIMDLSPTMCEMARAPAPPEQDGVSLAGVLDGGVADATRAVVSELLSGGTPARMVRRERWKYVSYSGHEDADVLGDMEGDPGEYRNCRAEHPEAAASLRALLDDGWDPGAVKAEHERHLGHWRILSQWGANVPVAEPDRWSVPQSAWELPKP